MINATARPATEKADFRPALLSRPYAGLTGGRMAKKRESISKRVRFEVFKRDSFKCQYCGKAAPDVVLHVDHILPVSKGGDAEILNLITACLDCNAGKSDVELSDDAAIKKQQRQLEELNEKREQLEMLVAWRKELASITEDSVTAAHEAWGRAARGWSPNEKGLATLRRLIHKFGLAPVLQAIETAGLQYLTPDADGNLTQEAVEHAWSKIGGICRLASQPDWKRQIYYIRGILRNRLEYVNQGIAIRIMEDAVEAGVSIEWLSSMAREARSWSQFQDWVSEATNETIVAKSRH